MTKKRPTLSKRLEALLADPDKKARPSHILREIEAAAVGLSEHAQENLSDLIEWLQEAESLAQAGKLADVAKDLEKKAKKKLPELDEAAAEKPVKKTKKKAGVEIVGPPKAGTVPFARVFIDGGARGNPGPSAIGIVMEGKGDKVVWTHCERIGTATNNTAEYTALIMSLAKAVKLGVHEIDVFSDAELIVKQMKGEYRVKNADLKPLWQQAQSLSRQFSRFRIQHIRREQNRVADALVNQALDEIQS